MSEAASSSWAARVYEADKRSAELCRSMSQNGFGFDLARAKTLADALRASESEARARIESIAGRPIRGGAGGGFSSRDLSQLFFRELRAPVIQRSELTGAPSLGVDVLRAYAASAREDLRAISLAILEWRNARKLRVTYIDNVPVGFDGRVHPSWLSYGAVSGRWACQGPNLMNLPTRRKDPTAAIVPGGIRGLYWAPAAGRIIFSFDCSQLEMRICAYASGDPAMIASCETSDMHAANAAVIFESAFTSIPSDDPAGSRKAMRDLAKQSGFAIAYLAEAETVYGRIVAEGRGDLVSLRQIEMMLRKLRRKFRPYYAWQEARLLDAIRLGWTDEPVLGRRRYVGHDPSPTETANFPIQAGAAGHMNSRLPIAAELLARECGALAVAQVHDSGVFEMPARHEALARRIIVDIFEAPQQALRGASLPVDFTIGERWK